MSLQVVEIDEQEKLEKTWWIRNENVQYKNGDLDREEEEGERGGEREKNELARSLKGIR